MEQTENDIKWFMQFQGQVQGPFNSTRMQETLDGMDSHQMEIALVWRRGFAEWVKASKWLSPENTRTMATTTDVAYPAPPVVHNPPPVQKTMQKPKAPIPTPAPSAPLPSAATMVTQVQAEPSAPAVDIQIAPNEDTVIGANIQKPKSSQSPTYRVQVNFIDQPMMSKSELLTLIAQQEDISTVAIQDPKTKEWKEVYAFPDIVEKLGISRRKHARVPILAQFVGRTNRHDSFNARIITISEGGLGLTEVYDLKIGDIVEGQLTSPHFFQPINIRADVVYSGLDGYIGLNFTQINDESKAAIIDYMKKFGKTSTGNLQG